jgi:hypothetical protein
MGSRYSMTLKRDAKSGAFKDRIRLPEDVRLKYHALYGPAWEEKFHEAADTPPDKARAEHAAWAAKVKGRIAALRDSKGGKGVDLTQRQADALAGDWYRWFTAQHLDNPGSPNGYDIVRYELGSLAVEAGDPEAGEADFDDPEVLSEVDTLARASQFLTDHGISLTQAGRTRFLSAVVREFFVATKLLERRARGDWSKDKHLDKLAPFEPLTAPSIAGNANLGSVASSAGVSPSASASQVFEAYILDKQPKTSTVSRWRGVFAALDAAREAEGPDWDAQQWLDSLRTENRSARTVRDIWLSAARTVFAWAVRKRRVPANPFQGCTVDGEGVHRGRGPDHPACQHRPREPFGPLGGRQAVGAVAMRLLGGSRRRAYPVAGAGHRAAGLWPCPAHHSRCRHGEDRQGPHSPHTSPFGRDGSAGLRRDGQVSLGEAGAVILPASSATFP